MGMATMLLLPLIGGVIGGAGRGETAIIVIAVLLGTGWLGLGVGYAVRPRLQVAFVPGRALLMKGRHEVGLIAPGRARVVIVQRRISGRKGPIPIDSVRWWFFLPKRSGVYIDDLSPNSTPWGREIALAAAAGGGDLGWPGVCPKCGYPTKGLRTDVCPECGAAIL